MRIISGTSKSRRLHTLKGRAVRPTADRVREALFNIIGTAIEGKKVLDLFAGFGGMGLEALSRGAQSAIFVEKSKKVGETIKSNLGKLAIPNAQVYTMDVFRFLKLPKVKEQKFDFVFTDPPYALFDEGWIRDLWQGISHLLNPEGRFILEHPSKWIAPERIADLNKNDTRKYGQTAVSFYEKISCSRSDYQA